MDKDIDILAEEAWKNRGHSGYETIPALYKEGYISGSSKKWSDEDILIVMKYASSHLSSLNGIEKWLLEYKKSKGIS